MLVFSWGNVLPLCYSLSVLASWINRLSLDLPTGSVWVTFELFGDMWISRHGFMSVCVTVYEFCLFSPMRKMTQLLYFNNDRKSTFSLECQMWFLVKGSKESAVTLFKSTFGRWMSPCCYCKSPPQCPSLWCYSQFEWFICDTQVGNHIRNFLQQGSGFIILGPFLTVLDKKYLYISWWLF